MKSKISKIYKEIQEKRDELFKEIEKFREKYGFELQNGKIVFNKEKKEENKKEKTGSMRYMLWAQIRHIISMPFIYMMIVPTIIFDIFLFVYQQTCFRLYGIPLVRRRDYITAERKHLDYLNWIQKINCLYCSYVNGIFSYAVEIWGRTEKYWCPIKHARKNRTFHNWQDHFADYWDAKGFKKTFNSNKEYYEEK